MKTLFISFAFFLYADNPVWTASDLQTSSNNETVLTLEELMKFRGSSTDDIDRALLGRGWENNTAENLKKGYLEVGQQSWQFLANKNDIFPTGELYYTPESTSEYEGPQLTYMPGVFGNRISSIDDIIEKASAKKSNLTKCKGSEHEEEFDDEDYENMSQTHFYNKNHNFIFTTGEYMALPTGSINVYGKKKK